MEKTDKKYVLKDKDKTFDIIERLNAAREKGLGRDEAVGYVVAKTTHSIEDVREVKKRLEAFWSPRGLPEVGRRGQGLEII